MAVNYAQKFDQKVDERFAREAYQMQSLTKILILPVLIQLKSTAFQQLK